MRFFKLTIAYDGTNFAGWQFQPGQRTVQGKLEAALSTICAEPVQAVASGRTDSGVHALAQVVSFASQTQHEPEVLQRALNAELPDDISILQAEFAPDGFHAIRDAISKRYRYVIHDSRIPEVFRRQYVWQLFRRLDEQAMHRAAQALLGEHDFSCFESKGAPRHSSIRTIREIVVRRLPPPLEMEIHIEVEADGFLYNIETHREHVYRVGSVGTLVHNSCGKLSYDALAKTWTSQAGLVYGQGSIHGNRVKHVLDHLVANPNKTSHSLFNVKRNQLIGLIDQAWLRKGNAVPGDPGAYLIDMGRVIGTAGEQYIKLIVKPGTKRIITAYPIIP